MSREVSPTPEVETPNPSLVLLLYYTRTAGDGLDWRHRSSYIAKHGMTPQIADEAYADPASRSGRTVRVIGWSVSIQALVTVIVLPDTDVVWGVNAWRSNAMDRHRYGEGDDRWTLRN